MKFLIISFCSICILLFVECQEDEITFGGASEEEEEEPQIGFNINSSYVEKSEMQYLYVFCNVSQLAPSKVKGFWKNSKGEQIMPSQILYFNSILKEKEGRYTCELEHGKMKFNKTLDLKVTIPSISIQILQDESLRIGGSIHRKCSDLGLEPSTVVDTFKHSWVNEKGVTVSTSDELYIPVTDTSVSGVYECRYKSKATSKVYTAKTTAFINEEARISKGYQIKIITDPDKVTFSKKFSMKCEVKPSDLFSYRWFRNNEPISTDQTIYFTSFQKQHTGTYKCIATIRKSNGEQHILEAESIQEFTLSKKNDVELTTKPGPQIFMHAGDTKELHCEIPPNSGKRGRDVEWFFNGTRIQRNGIKNIGRVDRETVSILALKDASPLNEGLYECLVGLSRKEATIIILIEAGIIETNPKLERVKEGYDVEFHCMTENIPNVKNTNLKWRFESKDKSLSYDIPNSRWKVTNPTETEKTSFIDLTSAQVHDSGYLICTEPNGATARSELIVIPSDANVIIITPKEIRVRPGQRFDIECFSKNREGRSAGQPKFIFSNDQAVGRDARFAVTNVGPSHIRLTAPNGLTLSDDNMNILCANGDQRATSRIFIKDSCPPGYRYCRNGQCLENSKFCDGRNDCDDKSDEDVIYCKTCDPISKRCEVYNGVTPTKNYYLIHWTCDGEEDCGNGYDENNCGDGYFENCGGKFYKCADGKNIPRGYLCDQNADCSEGDDENACSYPAIIETSKNNIKAGRRQQITMTCKASGKPLPNIIWRFNWGCISKSERFVVRSYSRNCSTVTSTLTINDFQPGDDGIYNCEALSSRHRAFSNDFQVVLQNENT